MRPVVREETLNVTDGIDLGRQAFERQVWGDAFRNLSAADIEHPLGPEDLERLAVAAYLVGRGEDSVEAWTRAHKDCARHGDVAHAVRWAF